MKMKKLNSIVRPMLMTTLSAILINNYIILPYFDKVIDLPSGFWGLATVFAGIYAGGRSYEKKNKTDDDV